MAAKARKLRRAGKEKEAMDALAEAAKLREQAANWKPEEEFEVRSVPKFRLSWRRSTLFTRPISRTYDEDYILRELWTDKFDMLNDYLDLKNYKNKELTCHTNDSRYTVQDIEAMCKLLSYYGEKKTRGDWVTYYWKNTGSVDIEVLKSDENTWRFRGEKTWRHMPVVKM